MKWEFLKNAPSHSQMIKLKEKIHTKAPDCSKCSNGECLSPLSGTLNTTSHGPSWSSRGWVLHCLLMSAAYLREDSFLLPSLFQSHLVFSTSFSSSRLLTDGSFTTNQPSQTHSFHRAGQYSWVNEKSNVQELIYRMRNPFIPSESKISYHSPLNSSQILTL